MILISATSEWRAVRRLFSSQLILTSPFGEYFDIHLEGWDCVFFFGGWGKISAAASTQYVIDHHHPDLLVNLGTCGGFRGEIEQGDIVLVEKTIVYDIIEQMGDFDEHIAFYTTLLDLSWLNEPYPISVRRTILVSGDRDLLVDQVAELKQRYHAVAGDWESGAVAWTANRNGVRLLILRGVTDLVDEQGNPAYGDLDYFERESFRVMEKLVNALPAWLGAVSQN